MTKKTNKNGMSFKPVIPNWSISNWYLVQLRKMTNEMLKDILQYSEFVYKQNDGEIKLILDENPIARINKLIIERILKWQKIFSQHSRTNAREFIDGVDDDVQRQLKKNLQKATDFITIKFDKSNQRALLAKQAKIKENVELIRNIPEKMQAQIVVALNETMSRGGDWDKLKTQLVKIADVTERRALTIAKDQVFKATSVISHARQAELGITKQTWDYTYISKEPRKSHMHANGKIYEIDKGCLIDGEYIFPAELYNCKCSSAPFLEFS